MTRNEVPVLVFAVLMLICAHSQLVSQQNPASGETLPANGADDETPSESAEEGPQQAPVFVSVPPDVLYDVLPELAARQADYREYGSNELSVPGMPLGSWQVQTGPDLTLQSPGAFSVGDREVASGDGASSADSDKKTFVLQVWRWNLAAGEGAALARQISAIGALDGAPEAVQAYRVELSRLWMASGAELHSDWTFGGTQLELLVAWGAEAVSPSVPGAPLLRLQARNPRSRTDVAHADNSWRVLYRLKWDSQAALVQLHSYTYRADGSLYLRRLLSDGQSSAGSDESFILLSPGDIRVIEIMKRENGSQSYRRYDDRGRLMASQGESDNLEIEHSEDGSRVEREVLQDGRVVSRWYSPDNLLTASRTRRPSGAVETRTFEYDEEGRILIERYSGALGDSISEYRYQDGKLVAVQSYRDGVLVESREIREDLTIETRYLRGVAVLRIAYRDGRRVYEEELAGERVIRRREYTQESGQDNQENQ